MSLPRFFFQISGSFSLLKDFLYVRQFGMRIFDLLHLHKFICFMKL